MGQISRMNRARRFIDEFDKDYRARSSFHPGQKLTVKDVSLAMRENTEEVIQCLVLEDDKGETHEVEIPDTWFDPDAWSPEETTDQIVVDLGLTEEEARRRVQKANL